ncbi:MAG: FAD-binding oxidoreductase [Deltaproteobacteria bacterium]|nr:FAD-binding oxidoreductase [Deltaproteobacteria bacterium]
MSTQPERADVVVIGAGFAGLSSAAGLALAGADVVVLEAEPVPGAHSSGKNAAIARRLIDEPSVARLATVSLADMVRRPTADGHPIVRVTGGVLLGADPLLERLWQVGQATPGLSGDMARWGRSEVLRRVPALAGARVTGAIHVAQDGVVDTHALLQSFLAPLKKKVLTGVAATGIRVARGRVEGVETPAGVIATGEVVDAAGFHANRVAALAGLGPMPFQPVRRHLFVTGPTDLVGPEAPWVWDGTIGYYFRREGAGLLLCACDQTPWPEDAPFDAPADPDARTMLADKFDAHVPGLREVRPTRAWAGLRILTPDDRFVIGRDPRLGGFTWVAGLGGHGVTTACGIEMLVTELLAHGEMPEPWASAFDPARFS